MGDVLTASVATPAESLRRLFAEHGVVVMADFLDHEQLALLQREIDAHYGPMVQERFGIDAVSRAGIEMDCEGQAWHQDCPPDDPSRFNLNRLFYLQDTEIDDGAVVVVPGSHRAGRISPGLPQEPIPGEVVLTPRAGTLVLLHGHTYHRVTPNVSRRPRVSVNLRAFPADVSPGVARIGIYRNAAYDFQAGKQIER